MKNVLLYQFYCYRLCCLYHLHFCWETLCFNTFWTMLPEIPSALNKQLGVAINGRNDIYSPENKIVRLIKWRSNCINLRRCFFLSACSLLTCPRHIFKAESMNGTNCGRSRIFLKYWWWNFLYLFISQYIFSFFSNNEKP